MEVLINGKICFTCTKQEIHEAFDVLRNASRLLEQRTAINFYPGQKVSFQSRRGMRVIGTILRVNRTSITIRQDDALTTWKVSPSLLRVENEPLKRSK